MALKNDLVTEVLQLNNESEIKLNKSETAIVVSNVLDAIIQVTSEHGELKLDKFGKFIVRERAARKGRIPSTGEEIDIPASKSPAFTPFKEFKESIN